MNPSRPLGGAPERLRGGVAVLVVAASLGAVAGFVWGISDSPRWQAKAELVIDEESGSRIDPARLATLVSSEQVAVAAAGRLGNDVAGADLLSQIEATTVEGGVEVSATSELAIFAAAAANAFAESAADLAVRREQRRLRNTRDRLREEVDQLDPASAEAAELADRLGELDQALAEPGAVEVASEASLPEDPISSRSAAGWTFGGALVGLLAGALWLLARRPRAEPIESMLELAPLGRVVVSVPRSSTGPMGLEVGELLSRLGVGYRRTGPGVVAVTATGGGEHRSELAAAITLAAVSRGRKALLVDCDLTGSRQAELLGVASAPGLADYLRGLAGPREVLRPLPAPGASGEGVAVALPSGESESDDPLALLGSDLFAALIARTAQVYDLLILDVPAIVPAAEQASICLGYADAAVLACERGRTRSGELAAATPALDGIEPALCAYLDLSGESPG